MYKKQGYLKEEFKIFRLKDNVCREFSFHYHDFYKIVVFMEGKVTYSVEGKNYELKPGDIVLVSKDQLHKPIISAEWDYERIVLYLSQSFLDAEPKLSECFIKAKEEHTNVMRLSNVDYHRLSETLNKAYDGMSEKEYLDEVFSKIYVYEALAILNRSIHENGFLFAGAVSFDRKIVSVCEYINNNLGSDLSVDSLSEMFYVSKAHLMRRFKDYTGVTIHNYILEKRLLYTANLCREGQKVTVACIEAGFKDYSTYLRAKKRMTLRLVESNDHE